MHRLTFAGAIGLWRWPNRQWEPNPALFRGSLSPHYLVPGDSNPGPWNPRQPRACNASTAGTSDGTPTGCQCFQWWQWQLLGAATALWAFQGSTPHSASKALSARSRRQGWGRSARPDLFLPGLPGCRRRNQSSVPASRSPSQTSSSQRGVALRAGHTGPTSSLPCRPMRRLIGLVRHATLPTEPAQH